MSEQNIGGQCQSTDTELWRERPDDYYADSLHVTSGGGIGMNCGGYVIVMPIRAWHALAKSAQPSEATAPQETEKAVAAFVREVRDEAIRLMQKYRNQTSASALQEAFDRIAASMLPSASSHVAASGSQGEPKQRLVPLPDAAAICECGSTMVCPDIGCDRHKGAAPAFPFQPSAGIAPQSVQGGEAGDTE